MQFAELTLGQSVSETIPVTREMVVAFAELTGDRNPIHLDPEYAKPRVGGVIAHGALLVGLFSRVMGMGFPGPGTVGRGFDITFTGVVRPGDSVRIELKVTELVPRIRKVVLEGNAYVGEKSVARVRAQALMES